MQLLACLAVVGIGSSIGSFLGAYTFRKPRKLSVAVGRSFCPNCKAKIAWFDNIPLLSFVLLRGRCRACGKKISVRYPLIEGSVALIFLILFREFTIVPFIYFSAIAAILTAIFVIDLEQKIIPDEVVFWGILFVLGSILLFNPDLVFQNLLVGFAAAFFFLTIHLLTRGRGMGLGDVKFAILGGLVLGWPQTIVWLFLAFISGAVVGLFLILLKRAKFGREIPFGPFLSGALLFSMIYGDTLIKIYLK